MTSNLNASRGRTPSIDLAQRLRAGESCFMLKLNLASPKLAEMAALAGVDAIWLDREHGGADWTTAYHSILAASRHQTATVVRVAKGSYSDMVQPLELGATA